MHFVTHMVKMLLNLGKKIRECQESIVIRIEVVEA